MQHKYLNLLHIAEDFVVLPDLRKATKCLSSIPGASRICITALRSLLARPLKNVTHRTVSLLIFEGMYWAESNTGWQIDSSGCLIGNLVRFQKTETLLYSTSVHEPSFSNKLYGSAGLWSAQPSWACRRAQGNGTVHLQAPGKRKQHFTVTSLECLRLFWLLSWKADKETITQKDMWPISGQRGNSVLSNFDNSSAC